MSNYTCLSQCIDKEDTLNDVMKMCMSDCTPENFTAPLIWIGFYIAAASLVCMLLMGTDLVKGIRMKKYWFPCKYFTLNAAISALLAIALKMPVDLSTPMPCGRDQLMKLSATAFVSVSMGNFMPSLAGMSDPELFANLMALAVFIVPLITNICIQMGTGVIYHGASVHHVIIIFCIAIQFALLVSTAIACPSIKQQLQEAYNNKAKSTDLEEEEEEEELKKQWIMAQTSSPQFVIARSVVCTASGAICVLTLVVLVHAMFRLYITMENFLFFNPSSDYRWSANIIVSVQAAAVLVASISPISRWFRVVWYKLELEGWQKSIPKKLRTIEPYWTQRLNDLRKIKPDYEYENVNNFLGKGNNIAMDFFIKFQNFTISSCKIFCLVSSVFLISLMYVYSMIISTIDTRKIEDEHLNWVLKLENESDLTKTTIKKIISVFNSYFKTGAKEAISKNQMNLLKKSDGFDGIKEFDKELIEGLTKIIIKGVSTDNNNNNNNNNNPNGSWAIMIVTLSTIVCAIKTSWDQEFVSTVKDILPLVIYVEKALGASQQDAELDAINMWKDVLKYKKRLNIELPIISNDGYCLKTKLETLITRLSTKYKEGSHDQLAADAEWMKETAVVVLQFLRRNDQLDLVIENKKEEEHPLCKQMTVMVLDIIVTCLVHLKRAVTANISNASMENRELVVENAVSIYGKTLEIQNYAEERFSSIINDQSLDHKEYLHASWWKLVKPKPSNKKINERIIGDDIESKINI